MALLEFNTSNTAEIFWLENCLCSKILTIQSAIEEEFSVKIPFQDLNDCFGIVEHKKN